jgi:AraC-like DNA-binding protein
LTYLGRWRLQLAARKLQTTQDNVLNVAADVGYESEAAFNRAFKREFGVPPARYRKNLAGHGDPPLMRRMINLAGRRGPARPRA